MKTRMKRPNNSSWSSVPIAAEQWWPKTNIQSTMMKEKKRIRNMKGRKRRSIKGNRITKKEEKTVDQSNTKEGNREEEQSKIQALEIEAWTNRESSGRIRGREEAEGDTDGPTGRKKRRNEEGEKEDTDRKKEKKKT